uniref:(northern house mosquito) hypothetical protein n=1 Tax=Culex pipiens TaxID=7175 RepID=A0A8D8I031_CULPI
MVERGGLWISSGGSQQLLCRSEAEKFTKEYQKNAGSNEGPKAGLCARQIGQKENPKKIRQTQREAQIDLEQAGGTRGRHRYQPAAGRTGEEHEPNSLPNANHQTAGRLTARWTKRSSSLLVLS